MIESFDQMLLVIAALKVFRPIVVGHGSLESFD